VDEEALSTMALADERREYGLGGLDRPDLADDPLVQFRRWFGEMHDATGASWLRRVGIALFHLWHAILGRPPADATATVLATANASGQPSARTVLLKGMDERGFSFFTNYDSQKGRELTENPEIAACFPWHILGRQVRLTGRAERTSEAVSDAYFATRPRESRIGAWASAQSEVIADRSELDAGVAAFEARFDGVDVPRPPNWGGFRLVPTEIEFWQGRPSRLHDRFRYRRVPSGSGPSGWIIERLSP